MIAPTKHRPILGLFLGFIGVAAFSLTLPMTRFAVTSIDAGTIIIWRGLIAALFSAVILLVFYRQWPRRESIRPLLITGVGIVIGFPGLMTLAMQTVPASHGAVVVGLLPISTAAVSVLATNENPSRAFWIVSGLGTMAIMAFVFRLSDGGFAPGHFYLIAAVVFAAVGYAFGGNAAKEIGAPRAICWALVLMSPFLVAGAFFVAPLPLQAEATSLLAFLYLALVSQLAGFFAWYGGLALGGVARVSQIQLLQIFMTLIASAVLLSEPLNMEIWFFSALVMCCVVVSARLRIDTVAKG